ncbi:hypothetical protein GBA63_11320 [Rubrobacter tropicus]|uniref:Uncharacterized protein n=1 Tax=Rubrobacter tropicus TaxID=2653851 RepID=A0A6G8Q9M0_9ACTN|nr:hypothetical protein [Rubrobacter tropicus]QIN83166.1 hypothetical protein GBA63_11320 [Rubrobacter tropicus]
MILSRIDLRCGRLRTARTGLLLITAGVVSLSGCGGSSSSSYSSETASHHEPARIEPIKGTDVMRVIFSAEGAERVGLETDAVRQEGQELVVPDGAVIYDAEGNAYAYTAPKPLTFVRQEIEIDRSEGNSVMLSDGPPAGTEVVTVGTAEVYGTEFEVAH